jgi:hypothetical protein
MLHNVLYVTLLYLTLEENKRINHKTFSKRAPCSRNRAPNLPLKAFAIELSDTQTSS